MRDRMATGHSISGITAYAEENDADSFNRIVRADGVRIDCALQRTPARPGYYTAICSAGPVIFALAY
ncbi:MAG: hypothetical protein LC770_06710, partial [Acidobacteria bacterium]|nr:hypothetical protein [Acidobacteriota bacterium]